LTKYYPNAIINEKTKYLILGVQFWMKRESG
jgi:hypothetical protein